MSQPLEPGSVIGGRYRIVRLLGVGGMGAVYEAENTVTGKRVALKWMHPQVASDPEAAQRFTREAQASSRIRHPNVVDVYDILHEGDAVFMVMELLEGESLGALLERGGASVPQLIALLLGGMRGVAKAHKQGVVHRDIKPDNIFLARQEESATPVPKVLDFGISKMTGVENLSLTRTGATIGTPLYMSLEQLTGQKDIDLRTDVYAFGVILYEIVTGQLPFQAETLTELAVKIATEEPPAPKALQPSVPTALERLILWAMTKKRDERLPSLDRFIEELEPFASEQGYQRAMTLHAASLPHAPTVVAAPAPALVHSAVAAAPVPRTTAFSQADDPVTLPVRRLPWRTFGVLALLAALAGAAASKLGGNEPVPAAPAQASAPQPASEPVVQRDPVAVPAEPVAAATPVEPTQAAPKPEGEPGKQKPRERAHSARDKPAASTTPPASPLVKPAVAQTTAPSTAEAAHHPAAVTKPPAAQPAPATRPAAAPAAAASPKPPTTGNAWTPVPMPRRSFMGGLFGNDAQSARRRAMLQNGPPYRSISALKQAYTRKQIDEQTYEDNVWALKTWRSAALASAKQEYKNGSIDRAEYDRRLARIDAQYKGP